MRTIIKNLQTGNDTQAMIVKMLPIALSNVPFHQNTESITRYFAENLPVHLAVHEVSPVTSPPEEYTQLHVHEDSDELNIIISQDKLLYRIRLGDDEFIAGNDSSIWIPRGTPHSANVLKGSGYFITLRMQ